MTNFKDSVFAKVTTGVVAFSAGVFMLGLVGVVSAPSTANAQSNAELQAQIQSLLETIANLQAQVDGGGSAGISGTCPSSIFSLRAGQGATGQNVKDLQMFLNMDADTQVAASGPGSPGNETVNYGPLTASAVSDFQAKYSSDVLSPLGLSAPTGYWGNSSASKAQSLCASMADDSDDGDDDSDDSDDDSDDSDSDDLSGGEASLEDFDINSGDDDDIEEGDTGEVAEVEFDVEDGDVRVSRIDVAFRPNSGNNAAADDEPWDVFEEVSLIVDGDEIASKNVDDDDDWLNDDEDSNGFYEVRFSGVNWVVREGDTAEFTIAVEVASNVDDVSNNPTWETNILEDGIRAVDSEGINQYIGNSSDTDTISFDLEAEGADEELNVTSSSDDPDQSVIQVNENKRSDEYGVFAWDMEAEGNDLDINELVVDIDLKNNGSNDYGDIVRDAYLEIDGEQFDVDDKDFTNGAATATLTFDIDGDLTIDEDDEVTAWLFLEFRAENGNYAGSEIRAKVDADDFDVEGADDLSASQLDGAATGNYHTLLVKGLYAEGAAERSASQSEGLASYEFVVDLHAFESDVYLSATSTSNESDAFEVTMSGTGTTTYDFVTDADQESNDSYKIDKGSTEEFTITVTFDPPSSGSYRATLDSVNYALTNSDDPTGESYSFTPKSDFRTKAITVPGTGDASSN